MLGNSNKGNSLSQREIVSNITKSVDNQKDLLKEMNPSKNKSKLSNKKKAKEKKEKRYNFICYDCCNRESFF